MKRNFIVTLIFISLGAPFIQVTAETSSLQAALKHDSVKQLGRLKPFLAVSPARFEVDLNAKDAQTTRTITLVNPSTTTQKIRVDVHNFSLNENNEAVVIEPDEQSLDQWMIINPLEFTLAPNASQTVRFAIRPRAKPEPGEHRAMIYFTQKSESNDATSKVNLNVRVGVPVYAHAGTVNYAGSLDSIDIRANYQQIKLMVKARNDGNKNLRLGGNVAIWKESQFSGENEAIDWLKNDANFLPDVEYEEAVVLAQKINQSAILPGSIRTVDTVIDIPIEPDNYVLGVYARAVDSEEIKFVRFKR